MSTEKEIVQKIVDSAVRFTPQRDGVVLTRGSDIRPEPIAWLWLFWLALGKLLILAGAPGAGKTTIALALAATLTSGGRWPDGSRCEPANVLIWSGEDDPADTLVPRLIGMCANMARVYFMTGTRIDGEMQSFDPARDMAGLQAEAERVGNVRLIVVDPVVSAVTGDSHKNTEVRRALQPLVDLASGLGAAIIGITHLTKGSAGRDPTERVTGSIAFSAVARLVLLAAKIRDGEGKDKRVLVRSKSNIGPDDGGFEYDIEQAQVLPGIHSSIVTWGAAIEGNARELLAQPDDRGEDGGGAVELLRAELVADCWTPAETACKPLRDAGFSKKQIWAVSKRLGVIRRKGAMQEGWYWRLPPSAEGSEGSSRVNVES